MEKLLCSALLVLVTLLIIYSSPLLDSKPVPNTDLCTTKIEVNSKQNQQLLGHFQPTPGQLWLDRHKIRFRWIPPLRQWMPGSNIASSGYWISQSLFKIESIWISRLTRDLSKIKINEELDTQNRISVANFVLSNLNSPFYHLKYRLANKHECAYARYAEKEQFPHSGNSWPLPMGEQSMFDCEVKRIYPYPYDYSGKPSKDCVSYILPKLKIAITEYTSYDLQDEEYPKSRMEYIDLSGEPFRLIVTRKEDFDLSKPQPQELFMYFQDPYISDE